MLTIKPDDVWHAKITEEVATEYKLPPPGKLCLDIGANTGAFTLKVKDQFKTIVAIEAYSENYRYMLGKIGNLPNVVPLHAAVWSKSGEILNIKAFNVSHCPGHHSVINWWVEEHVNTRGGKNITIDSRGWSDKEKLESVCTISLDDLVKRYGHVDLLKIDVEGAEFDILYGKDLSMVDAITGEIHLMLGANVPLLEEYLGKYFKLTKYKGDGISTNIVFDGVKLQ